MSRRLAFDAKAFAAAMSNTSDVMLATVGRKSGEVMHHLRRECASASISTRSSSRQTSAWTHVVGTAVCTVRVAGPRHTGHTSAIHDLRIDLEQDLKLSTIALTAVAACERRERGERTPVFTPMRQLDKAALAEIVFVDNAFSMSGATEGRVYASPSACALACTVL